MSFAAHSEGDRREEIALQRRAHSEGGA